MLNLIALALSLSPSPVHPPHPRFPHVQLADASGWGIDPEDARYFWKLSRRHIDHHRDYIAANYTFATYQLWVAHAQRCNDAWDVLDNVLHPSTPKDADYRLGQLERLRAILGPEAFEARRMPPPCPGWMFCD